MMNIRLFTNSLLKRRFAHYFNRLTKLFGNVMYWRLFLAPITFTFSIAISIYCQYSVRMSVFLICTSNSELSQIIPIWVNFELLKFSDELSRGLWHSCSILHSNGRSLLHRTKCRRSGKTAFHHLLSFVSFLVIRIFFYASLEQKIAAGFLQFQMVFVND